MDTMNRHPSYSQRNEQLLSLLEQHAPMRAQGIAFDTPGLPDYLCNYGYRVGAWPVIIDAARIAEFEGFIRALPALYLKAMRLMFPDDAQAFADYLNVPALMHELVHQAEPDLRQALHRHDMLYSDGVLKLIEVNAGSTIGGWQADWLQPLLRSNLAAFADTASWHLAYRPVLDGMFGATLAAVAALRPARRGRVAFFSQNAPSEAGLEQLYLDTFAAVLPGALAARELVFFDRIDALGFGADNAVLLDGQPVDAVLLSLPEHMAAPIPLLMRLMAAQLSGKIVMSDSPLLTLLGNKLLMALLHEPALAPLLTAPERALVARHIPFSARLRDGNVSWRGAATDLRGLLLAQQRQFVIKKAHSLQGRDVHIGKDYTAGDWRALVDARLNQQDWLAQQFCPADLDRAPDSTGQMADHAFIWGIFDSGQRYGGAFVRAMPAAQGQGVINSATGAIEFAVFEETARQHRISL